MCTFYYTTIENINLAKCFNFQNPQKIAGNSWGNQKKFIYKSKYCTNPDWISSINEFYKKYSK